MRIKILVISFLLFFSSSYASTSVKISPSTILITTWFYKGNQWCSSQHTLSVAQVAFGKIGYSSDESLCQINFKRDGQNFSVRCANRYDFYRITRDIDLLLCNTVNRLTLTPKTCFFQEYQSLSSMAAKAGHTHLSHTTRPENLISILSKGTLVPGNKIKAVEGDPMGNHEYVFLSIVNANDSKSLLDLVGNRLPLLLFNLEEILDHYPFHANIGQPLGKNIPYTVHNKKKFQSAESCDRGNFNTFVHQAQNCDNELVFYQPIPLSHLSAIWVKRGTKESLLKQIQKLKISPPSGKNWEQLIIEVGDYTSDHKISLCQCVQPQSANSADIIAHALRQGRGEAELYNLLGREYPALRHKEDLFSQDTLTLTPSPYDMKKITKTLAHALQYDPVIKENDHLLRHLVIAILKHAKFTPSEVRTARHTLKRM